MGTLHIQELPVSCVIGVHPHERASRQQLLISVRLDLDFAPAAASDRLEAALDYASLAEAIRAFARDGRFRLIETLAERLADRLFETPVDRVEVTVWKPSALPGTRRVGVVVCRPQATGSQPAREHGP